jgi:hypothetical protein
MSRDFNAEFQKYVDAHPLDGITTAVAASQIVTELRDKDADLLIGWLDENAEHFITRFLGDRARTQRSFKASSGPRSAFSDAAERFERDGDRAVFDGMFVIDGAKTWRRLGDMSKDDHLFVASEHEDRSKVALFEAAFHRAVAKRIPKGKTTQDVMSEEEYLKLRGSIGTSRKIAA